MKAKDGPFLNVLERLVTVKGEGVSTEASQLDLIGGEMSENRSFVMG